MRKITKIAAAKKEPKKLTVRDVPRGAYFRIDEAGPWCKRTDSADYPAVSENNGYLYTADFCNYTVTEVLADGDSLTIGPEVKDGSAKNA